MIESRIENIEGDFVVYTEVCLWYRLANGDGTTGLDIGDNHRLSKCVVCDDYLMNSGLDCHKSQRYLSDKRELRDHLVSEGYSFEEAKKKIEDLIEYDV